MKKILKKPDGRDVSIQINDSGLNGVYYADYSVKNDIYEIREILSPELVDAVNKNTEYKITVKALPYVNSALFDGENFTLTFKDDGGSKTFSNCTTVKKECVVEAMKILELYEVRAYKMLDERNVSV